MEVSSYKQESDEQVSGASATCAGGKVLAGITGRGRTHMERGYAETLFRPAPGACADTSGKPG